MTKAEYVKVATATDAKPAAMEPEYKDYRLSTVLGKTLINVKLVAKEPYGVVVLDEANHKSNKVFIPYHNILFLIEGHSDDN